MRPSVLPQYARRGSATVEFALVVPVLVMILLFSMYLTELVRAKIKLQEFSRYVVWEMTSYTLSDFAKGNHEGAFTDAKREMMEEAVERYKDLDSAEPGGRGGNLIARYEGVAASLDNKEVPFLEGGMLGSTDEGYYGDVLGAVNAGANGLLRQWSFNANGWMETEATMRFNNVIIPTNYLNEGQGAFYKVDPFGGRSINSLPLRQRYSMYVDSWNLEDGSDATIRGRRAGAHREGDGPDEFSHGLYQQVDRMVFLGVRSKLEQELGIIAEARQFIQQFSPAFLGTFVVSHNYTANPSGDESRWARDCIGDDTGIRSYPEAAHGGLNNLEKFSQLDWPRPKCFDTAPFRDVPYRSPPHYMTIFQARGDFFMGCKNAQAEDPSAPTSTESTKGDKNTRVVNCE